MELNINSISSLFFDFAAVILIVFLLTSDTRKRLSNKMLSVYLILSMLDASSDFISALIFSYWPIMGMLLNQTIFMIFPALYFFAKASIYSNFKLTISSLLHLIPMIVVTVLLIPIFFLPLLRNPDLEWSSLINTGKRINLSYIILHAQIYIYYFFIFRMLLRYKYILRENYASPKFDNQKWLFQFFTILFILHLIATIKNIFLFGDNELLSSILNIVTQTAAVSIMFWLVIKALKKPDLFIGVEQETLLVNQLIEMRSNSEDGNSEHPEIIKKLENHMKVNEPFMDSSLSVYDLAKQINVPSRELSIAINHNLNKHFFDFVNEYRIKKAMEIFKNTNDDKLTVLEVLYEVGFNSKSSFNTAFKKFTGTTPSEFKRKASSLAA